MAEDMELEKILRSRTVPEMRSHLAERIIAASLRPETRQEKSARKRILLGFWDMFTMPMPVLSMLVLLMLGLIFGLSAEKVAGNPPTDIAPYYEIADITNFGDWS